MLGVRDPQAGVALRDVGRIAAVINAAAQAIEIGAGAVKKSSRTGCERVSNDAERPRSRFIRNL